jgi:hypothetical protein
LAPALAAWADALSPALAPEAAACFFHHQTPPAPNPAIKTTANNQGAARPVWKERLKEGDNEGTCLFFILNSFGIVNL